MGAMYLTADGATPDEAIGVLPKLPYPLGPNQYTPVTMLTLAPPMYAVQVAVPAALRHKTLKSERYIYTS
jgi:hypothetical protein